jgi:hypothetical protein
MQIPFAKKIADEVRSQPSRVTGTGDQVFNPVWLLGLGVRHLCCAQAGSQKKFGEWGLRWYSRANEKSRERLERP